MSESNWKRQLIEQDIRLQNAKLQVIELRHENKTAELRQTIDELEAKNSIIE